MKNFDGVHGPVERSEEEGRALAHQGDQLHPGRAIAERPANLVGVAGQGGPDEPRAAVGPALPRHDVGRQVDGRPTLTEGGGIGAELVEQVTEHLPLTLGEISAHRPDVRPVSFGTTGVEATAAGSTDRGPFPRGRIQWVWSTPS